jgi:hypothetical protein
MIIELKAKQVSLLGVKQTPKVEKKPNINNNINNK